MAASTSSVYASPSFVGHSLWMVPARPHDAAFQAVIDAQAAKLGPGHPTFPPHVTLIAGIVDLDEAEVVERTRTLCADLPPVLRCRVADCVAGSLYFQSVYALLDPGGVASSEDGAPRHACGSVVEANIAAQAAFRPAPKAPAPSEADKADTSGPLAGAGTGVGTGVVGRSSAVAGSDAAELACDSAGPDKGPGSPAPASLMPYMPHLSLVYGDMEQAVRTRIAAEVRPDLQGSVFSIRAVEVWSTQGFVAEWYRVATVHLGSGLSADAADDVGALEAM